MTSALSTHTAQVLANMRLDVYRNWLRIGEGAATAAASAIYYLVFCYGNSPSFNGGLHSWCSVPAHTNHTLSVCLKIANAMIENSGTCWSLGWKIALAGVFCGASYAVSNGILLHRNYKKISLISGEGVRLIEEENL